MSTPGQGSILGSPIIYGKVDYGPTLGQVYRPLNQKRVVTVVGTDTIQPFDQTVVYNKTVPAAFSVLLPDLNLWMTQPYGGFDLALIDGAGNAGTYAITVTPFGSQKIDGQSSASISANGGSLILVPLVDRTGWEVLSKASTGGGGGGDMLRANNLSDVLSVPTARTNLGITATGLDTTYNWRANNLSDVADVPTARSNLGLGTGSIEVVIDGSGSVLTTGLKGYLPQAPFACGLTQATMVADASGSIVVNIWKCTYAQFDAGATHPVAADKITASAPPTISSTTKSQDSTLTGWTTAIAAGDVLAFNIDSITTIKRIALSLKYTRT